MSDNNININTPEIGPYTHLQPFRFWCQKVLPLVYDESLSYYELLCKVVDYLNKTMEDVDQMITDMGDFQTADRDFKTDMVDRFIAFSRQVTQTVDNMQLYIDNYFDNLDVQQEINNKLDAMAAAGYFDTLFTTLFKDDIINEAGNVTSAWITENLLQETGYVIDNSLSVANAAADAKAAGDAITNVNDALHLSFYDLIFKNIGNFSSYARFEHYGLNPSGTFLTSQKYRVSCEEKINFGYDITVKCAANFKWGYIPFVNNQPGTWSGWYYPAQKIKIPADTVFVVQIAREVEDTSEIADVKEFTAALTFNTPITDKLSRLDMASHGLALLNSQLSSVIFDIGGLYEGKYYKASYPYRVATPEVQKTEFDIVMQITEGYKFGLVTYAEDETTYTDSGWITNPQRLVKVPANTKYRISIAKDPEGSVTPVINTYVEALKAFPAELAAAMPEYMEYSVNNGSVNLKKTKYKVIQSDIFCTPFTTLEAGSYQGAGFSNGVIFQGYPNGMIGLIDYETKTVIDDLDAQTGHSNAIAFLDEYYDEEDEFPLAIVSDTESSPLAYLVRFTRSAATKLSTISFPVSQAGYFANVMIDALNNIIYTVGYTSETWTDPMIGANKMIIAKWDWSQLTNNPDTTVTPLFIESFTVPFIHTFQGPTFYNGQLFVMSSKATAEPDTKIYVINPYEKRITGIIEDFPFRIKTYETEGICFTDDGKGILRNGAESNPYFILEAN